ncbi:UDP-N-acetylmuramate:L-alanyl-gamma-D-glutamyl-meso-diaminopimelate ligase [Gilliamella sp. App6-5]|jgi:UDP-N-acetylmuramate: L-alanyl-gamma-D-glutamyl-meso-diaminopimelate ligase|uniref:UDP-N-acetylmuramate:L-alanyl-gamma-D-glutamyl- meso-diaminopimelate ligase n=1 Tax=Gilliamella sp. App6-5 TaxID=3120232 RepID=UPI00080DA41D|nr:UDP-N-acetylmuramate:L-alanyl-gamma-D-glutamyl-meso-diaminopimelate ligase [Gilliamella apicola]OCG13898.1 UDP-N-acetylmuramate:L-alanyl-gamma-D-glutamyl-meso-diaminopimelate ligase [Gilliamella apicola]
MHIHILGICGTFMAGIALIARSQGHQVTGSDKNVYPPMSTLLQKEHIDIIEGYDPSQLSSPPDLVIIGNALSRGNPCVEYILDNNIPYISAPQWLHDNVLRDRWVIAVAGTHGKTTTAGMVNWILEKQNYKQGFVIGGVPGNFDVSARLGEGNYFVIEADEYDCSFFDKRSKFMHYCPKTLIMNNLEFDHADIFDDLSSIQKQFHHLVRLVPSKGLIIAPQEDVNLKQVLAKGCWSEQVFTESETGWLAQRINNDASHFAVFYNNKKVGEVKYSLVGEHNMHNALMAIAAAHNVGIEPADACLALGTFVNAKRRLELYGEMNNIEIYDDFAHHPTAILATLEALRSKIGANRRILAVLEPRSNTMKLGVSKDELAPSLGRADEIFIFQPEHLPWLVADVVDACIQPAYWSGDIDLLVEMITKSAKPTDAILIMSNGGFSGIHKKILEKLEKQHIKNQEKLPLIK